LLIPISKIRSDSDPGIVASTLAPDGRPVYANAGGTTPTTTGKANFDQWFHDVPGVNQRFVTSLNFSQSGPVYTLSYPSFFPIDGLGYGSEAQTHNFGFTLEIPFFRFVYTNGTAFQITSRR